MIGPGSRLGRFEIVSLLGAGGMGRVYKATDSRLRRSVAIKVLPDAAAGDIERRRRFEREARAVANLNHPNICALHDFGNDDGVEFLVMEYLDGETLERRLGRGAMPLTEALEIATRVAAALASAHGRGIVHRDIKPGNVILTGDGPMLLDFGLALLRGPDTAVPEKPDESNAALTVQGTLVGTPNYMAPEQIEGGQVDARADVFAFGAMLFEMVTGRRAFDSPSSVGLLAAVCSEDPLTTQALPSHVPESLVSLLRNCLAKSPGQRWSTAHDVLLALRAITGDDAPPARRQRVPMLPWAIAAAGVLAAIALAMLAYAWRSPEPPAYRVAIALPPDVTIAAGQAPQVSPDGRRIVFVGSDRAGTSYLYAQTLDGPDAEPLPETAGALQPFWAPDGRRVGFFADGKLKTIDLAGGAPRTLADAPTPRGGTWSRDGIILFVPTPRSAPLSVSDSGGTVTPLPLGPGSSWPNARRWFPVFLPDGRHYLYLGADVPGRASSAVFVTSIDTVETRRLMPTGSSVVYVDGYLLVRQESALMAWPFDVERQQTSGPPEVVADSVAANAVTYQVLASGSASGVLAFLEARPLSQPVWMDRTGRVVGEAEQAGDYGNVCLSADGRYAAFDRADRSGNIDIWMREFDRDRSSRLTFDGELDFYLACGLTSQVFFASLRAGHPVIHMVDATSPGSDRAVLETPLPTVPSQISSDGQVLVYSSLDPTTGWDIWTMPLHGDGDPVSFRDEPSDDLTGRLSPDGRWMAYASNEGGAFEIYIEPFPAGTGRRQVSSSGGIQPRWRGDGAELYFLSPDHQLMAALVNASGASLEVSQPYALFNIGGVAAWESLNQGSQYAPTPDGQRFLVNRRPPAPLAITALINWASGL